MRRSPSNRRSWRVRGRIIATLVLGFAVVILALPGTASAHAALLSSDPGPDQRMTVAPTSIQLFFSESVTLAPDGLKLLDSRQRAIALQDVEAEGKVVSATVPPLESGGYVVTWRVISADSHPVGGAFTFAVGNADLVDTSTVSRSASRAVGVASAIFRAALFAAILVGAGLVLVRWITGPDAPLDVALNPAVAIAAGAAILATLGAVALQAANQQAGGLGDAFKPGVWGDVTSTRYGRFGLVRLPLLALVGGSAGLPRPSLGRFGRAALDAVVGLALVGIGYTLIASGHASSGRWRPAAVLIDGAHLIAAAFWCGGLVALIVHGRTAGWRETAALRSTRRFSVAAPIFVGLLLVSGTVQGARQVPTWHGLWSSVFGRLVIGKLALIVAVLAAALASRKIVRRAGNCPRNLARPVLAEIVGLCVVVGLTAALVDATPPSRIPTPSFTQVDQPIGAYTVQMLIDPDRVGAVALHVIVLGQNGLLASEVKEVTVTARPLTAAIEDFDVKLVLLSVAHYTSDHLVLPYAGDWRFGVTIRTGEFDQVSGEAILKVRA